MKSDRQTLLIWILRLLSVIVIFVVAELSIEFRLLSPIFLSKPSESIISLFNLFRTGIVFELLYQTLLPLSVAFVLSIIIGIYLGIIIGSVKLLREGIEPFVAIFFSIPKVLLVPIFWSIFGFSLEYKIAYSFVHGLPPILINVIAMAASTEESHLKIAKLYLASRLQIYQKIVLPAIIFGLLASLRMALNLCLIGVIIAEMFVGTTGIGFALRQYASTFKTPEFYALIYLLVTISVSVNLILLGLEKRIVARRVLRPVLRV